MKTASPLSLLIVDDDPSIRGIFTDVVARREEAEVTEASDGEEALRLLRERSFDVAFVDLYMPNLGGMELLGRMKEARPELDVVMVTAHGTIEAAVQAMKLGASDFLTKPFKLDQVALILTRARKVKGLRDENERLREELRGRYRAGHLIGATPELQRCHDLIDRVRGEECNVLVLGESGTGKELIARAIHYDGPRSGRPFVPIDCGAIPSTLLESELFGHEKGAFTGAVARRTGLFEMASGGTAFLDEIGEIPLQLQAVLLRAIEEKKVRPVGATEYKPADARIIAATNCPLEERVGRGEFRRDLYYRLNVVTIQVPPLRRRKDDVSLLAEHFVRASRGRGGRKIAGFSREALSLLQRYDWPGNVRELENVVERACTLGRAERIGVEDLPPSIVEAVRSGEGGGNADGERSWEEIEVETLRRLMRAHKGDTARVADILKVDRSTLYRKIKRYKLEVPRIRTGKGG